MTSRRRSFERNRLTLNTFVQGALALALGRAAGVDDVVFGVTVSGRPTDLDGADSTLGLFINSLPLRVKIDPAQARRGLATGVAVG